VLHSIYQDFLQFYTFGSFFVLSGPEADEPRGQSRDRLELGRCRLLPCRAACCAGTGCGHSSPNGCFGWATVSHESEKSMPLPAADPLTLESASALPQGKIRGGHYCGRAKT